MYTFTTYFTVSEAAKSNHSCYCVGQIQIGEAFLQTSFSILEQQPMDMLLGLDMLKRHQVSKGRLLPVYTTHYVTCIATHLRYDTIR